MRRLLALCLACLATPLPAQTPVEVDVELVLAVDVSRSMQPAELELQRRGYATALTSDAVLGAVGRGLLGRVAITYVEWAGSRSQRVIVPWTLLETAEDAEWIAAQILTQSGGAMRRTSISGALELGAQSIDANEFQGLRRVIDISGDGPNNAGRAVDAARDRVLAQGITINGLPLMTRDALLARWGIPDLDAYYAACVIGGPGAFLIPVTRWEDFGDAVRRKLVMEIVGAPARLLPAQMPAHPDYNCRIGEEIWQRNMDIFMEP
ncbi:DUF1194 domain-containing protein [Lutimaribacter sp. EGI FJ00015]|uniref:DUF1194 domain-containing protein n=1 Tax=Lutimaribacter degradans TaxID=2945989 RepID=A0ACC5ZS35_9RHOB|nr:DUF1194 domain-containing protein [Lutimaribacter sp. EGI FJ00013]MCM2560955.1 DUF1194 domain-containing protein [Lutimaribacter sp. EGI FJ00013]MCO0612099.1 DUF1194 domain-containing protein [Lutimaribacter sp. EGI FJ00015]MCO0634781.1 DUF1194 domain-containing protein [Lutimaribacter sp. EGI FJ00014]